MRLLLDHGANIRAFCGTYFAPPPDIEEYMKKYSPPSAQPQGDSTDVPRVVEGEKE